MAVACVIGNPAARSSEPLSLVREDVDLVLKFFTSKSVVVTNRDSALSLTSDQMRQTFKRFIDACQEAEGPYYFYFGGHAFERDDDIHLVGEEVEDIAECPVLQSLRLKDCLVSLEQLSGLKVLVLDACRFNASGEDDDEGFERQAAALLQNIPDLVLITSTSAGRAAYDGQFTRRLVERLNRLGKEHLPLPLQNYLDAIMAELSAELGEAQRPALSSFIFTQDWTLEDVVASMGAERGHLGPVTPNSLPLPPNTQDKEEGSSMSLRHLEKKSISAYLTDVREKSGGNITGYFMFSNGELEAADYSAYRDDGGKRLAPGYSLVEAAAIRAACAALEPAGRVMSRQESRHFGDLRAIIFGFARTIVTMTVPEPTIHLIGIFHPKGRYHYGMATNSQEDFLALVRSGSPSEYSPERRKALRESGEFDLQNRLENPDPIAVEKLLRPAPDTLSTLMSRSSTDEGRVAYCVITPGFRRGFVLLAQDDTREKRKTIRSVSASLADVQRKDGQPAYREECSPLGSRDFTQGILDILSQEQSMLRKAGDVERITGPLRTFWLSFNKAVVGVNPFDDVRDGKKMGQYFLLSVYVGESQADLRFNYGDARQLIRLLCDEAGTV